MIRIPAALALLALASCLTYTSSQYRSMSSGLVGCSPDEIKVLDERNVIWAGEGVTWTAECKGKRFRCSYSGAAQCTEESK